MLLSSSIIELNQWFFYMVGGFILVVILLIPGIFEKIPGLLMSILIAIVALFYLMSKNRVVFVETESELSNLIATVPKGENLLPDIFLVGVAVICIIVLIKK